jgi:hypothetical protein
VTVPPISAATYSLSCDAGDAVRADGCHLERLDA